MGGTTGSGGGLLDGAVALITGVGPGMGRSIACTLATNGAQVAIGARRPDRLEAVAADLQALGADPWVSAIDITDPDACRRLVDEVVGHFGRLDILVQNAHHEGDWHSVVNADPDEWRKVMDVNLFGALHLVQPSVEAMAKVGGGAIVLVNSGAALRSPISMGAYSASKAALAALTRTLALEVAPRHIRVNGIFLGPVAGENLYRSGQSAADLSGGSGCPSGPVPSSPVAALGDPTQRKASRHAYPPLSGHPMGDRFDWPDIDPPLRRQPVV